MGIEKKKVLDSSNANSEELVDYDQLAAPVKHIEVSCFNNIINLVY